MRTICSQRKRSWLFTKGSLYRKVAFQKALFCAEHSGVTKNNFRKTRLVRKQKQCQHECLSKMLHAQHHKNDHFLARSCSGDFSRTIYCRKQCAHSATRKVTFREKLKWLLVEKSRFSGKVAFRGHRALQRREQRHFSQKVAFREKSLFGKSGFSRTPRAPTPRETSLFAKSGFSRKVAFREKWLFADTARSNAARKVTFRKKWLFEKSGFSRKVAFREKWLFRDTARSNAARKVTFCGFSRKVAFREKRFFPTSRTPAQLPMALGPDQASQPVWEVDEVQ